MQTDRTGVGIDTSGTAVRGTGIETGTGSETEMTVTGTVTGSGSVTEGTETRVREIDMMIHTGEPKLLLSLILLCILRLLEVSHDNLKVRFSKTLKYG